jgi:hypothetical protein
MSEKLSIYRLCDRRNWHPCDECLEALSDEPKLQVWSFAVGEVEWLTDRFWILPSTAFEDLTYVTVTELREPNAAKCVEWIEAARTGELAPTDRYFAPDFAGELQTHGLTLRGYKGEPEHAVVIVTPAGDRLGLLMPMSEKHDDDSGDRGSRLDAGDAEPQPLGEGTEPAAHGSGG